MKEKLLKVWTWLKGLKWSWVFIFPIYGTLVHLHLVKIAGRPWLGTAALTAAMIVLVHAKKTSL